MLPGLRVIVAITAVGVLASLATLLVRRPVRP